MAPSHAGVHENLRGCAGVHEKFRDQDDCHNCVILSICSNISNCHDHITRNVVPGGGDVFCSIRLGGELVVDSLPRESLLSSLGRNQPPHLPSEPLEQERHLLCSDFPAETLAADFQPQHLDLGASFEGRLEEHEGDAMQEHEAAERNRHAKRACREGNG